MTVFRPALLIALLLLVPAIVAADDPDALSTRVSLLIGFPADDGDAADHGVLVVPGTVLPIASGNRADQTFVTAEQEHSMRLMDTGMQLVKSFNLARFEVAYSNVVDLEVDAPRDLLGPSESSQISLRVELLGFNRETASFEAKMFERSTIIAQPRVVTKRGEQAVIGSTNGEEAPYLFLVIEPAAGESRPSDGHQRPMTVGGDVSPPRAIFKAPPQYTEEARKERVQGVVIVRATIGDTGAVDDVEVLKGLPLGLTEAAVAAIESWRFEPATLDGEPVAVYYNLTINFRLDSETEKDGNEEE